MSEVQSTESVRYLPAVGFPGYRVGDDGSVWTCHRWRNFHSGEWRRLTPISAGENPHMKVTLKKGKGRVQKYVHVLVLEAFVGPRPEGMQACHDPDWNPGNNRLSNLRWGTQSDNTQDCLRHGRHFTPFARLPSASKSQQEEIRRRAAGGQSTRTIARSMHLGKSTVWSVIARQGVYKETLNVM